MFDIDSQAPANRARAITLPRPLQQAGRAVAPHWRQLARFGLVGASGMAVNTTLLYLLVEATRMPHLLAAAVSAEASILSNFALNDRWTFRTARSGRPWPRRLWRYNAVALSGMILSLALLAALIGLTELHYLVANVVAVGASTLWNYGANRRWTWAAARERHSPDRDRLVTLWRRPAAPARADLPTMGMAQIPAMAAGRPIARRGAVSFAGLPRQLPLGRLLLETGLIRVPALEEALHTQERAGGRLGETLVSLGRLRGDHLALALAHQRGLDYFDPRRFTPDEALPEARHDPWHAEHRVIPLASADGVARVVTAEATDDALIAAVAARLRRPVRPIMATQRDIENALHAVHRPADLARSARSLLERSPENSAHRVLTGRQRAVALFAVALLAVGLLLDPSRTLSAATALVTILYLAASVYKLYLVAQGGRAGEATSPAKKTDGETIDERELPVYTILVPLYREAAVLPQLTAAIRALDWPGAKLDVRLLLEEDDVETITAARAAGLPPYFTFVIVPRAAPRGKPRACNYGLIHARGEFVVIYDAEDIPEPDQLKKVYAAFRAGADDLACVQCRLNFYNPEQNVLTRWFTAEYSMFFDLLLPGLQRAGVPVPLGGTSNHFRRVVIERLGAWDPYNVTEDADLGVRLHKLGLRTEVLDSTTYEEANPRVGNWIRQRSRWIKGYVQTWLVHMRHPLALWRALGPRGFWGFQFMIGGTGLTLLLNPIYWTLTSVWFATRWGLIERLFSGPLFYLGGVALYLGNFVFVYVMLAGALERGHHRLVKYALLSPLYWALMSIAAWKGVLQLFYAPSYWEKTEHGLAVGAPPLAAARQKGDSA